MGSIPSTTRYQPTRFVYRIAVPWKYAGDPSSWNESNRTPREGVHHTDIYRSVQQARGAATRFVTSCDRNTDSLNRSLYTFGDQELQRAELVWTAEQPATWEPVN